jgi:hypothetical protein
MKHLCAQGIVTSFRIDVPKAHPLSNASLVHLFFRIQGLMKWRL